MAPSLSLIEAASWQHVTRTGPFGPFEVLEWPLSFRPILRLYSGKEFRTNQNPKPVLVRADLVSGNRREAGSGQPCRLFNHQGGDCRRDADQRVIKSKGLANRFGPPRFILRARSS